MTIGPRIVVTGLGAISPVGLNSRDTFDKLISGTSGVDRIRQFDPSALATQIAGEVKNFLPENYMDKKKARRIGRYSQFSIAAAREAITHSKLDLQAEDPTRMASIVASAIGDHPMVEQEMKKFFEKGTGKINPFTVSRASSNMAAGNVSMEFGLMGPGLGVASACATGSHAIASAWMTLKLGLADVAVTGGSDAPLSPSYVDSWNVMRAFSTRNDEPTRASRPFDRDRDGFVPAEGCGVLILETLKHAQKRDAVILAEFVGVGMSCDFYHLSAPHPDGYGAKLAMRQALQTAGLQLEDVDYINVYGTSTQLNDPMETRAIRTTFGAYADKVPVSSIKSMIGHCIGAAGALEALTCVMVINDGVIPPTINLDNPDPECDLDYVPHKARKKDSHVVISNSFAFGGQNCVLLFKRFK
ncbi:beta-ketoacyl-ACP synthase II [Acidobacteriota bacterium]